MARPVDMARSISLANKCQLLFGGAVLLIILVALIPAWVLAEPLVDQGQVETARQTARLWAQNTVLEPKLEWWLARAERGEEHGEGLSIRYWSAPEWAAVSEGEPFLEAAARRLSSGEADSHHEAVWDRGDRVYRYAERLEDESGATLGVVVVQMRSTTAAGQLLVYRLYILIAGMLAGALAVLVFYLITTRIILSPVRSLRQTAELVREGNLHIRSEIVTGDEFEELSEAFNSMLSDLAGQQAQLRASNRTLDLKLTELAERNVSLFEAARLKGEFLANVSHELRTPLNSIIGFAEILLEIAERDAPEGGRPADLEKRTRYLRNIVSAGRSLLLMINELLEMAKIEAGKIELQVQAMNVAETCEALLALIRPLAERKRIDLSLQLGASSGGGFVSDPATSALPVIRTDPHKFQQVVFNFLSNAVKFTPEGGRVTLRAERFTSADGSANLRVSVLDTGPGIPADRREVIFEKFSQLDGGHTREHEGTGLGLAIAKEFAALLGGEVQLESEPGRGSMFSLIVPVEIDEERARKRAAEVRLGAERGEAGAQARTASS